MARETRYEPRERLMDAAAQLILDALTCAPPPQPGMRRISRIRLDKARRGLAEALRHIASGATPAGAFELKMLADEAEPPRRA